MCDQTRSHVVTVIWLFIVAVAGNYALAAGSQDRIAEKPQNESGSNKELRLPIYQPPKLGAPQFRVGGGTRSINQLYALAPQHVGLTASPNPRLYWFISTGDKAGIRFYLSDGLSNRELLKLTWDVSAMEGITYLNLSDHGINLEEGTTYRWAISLTPYGGFGSETISSQGFVQYHQKPILENTPLSDKPFVAARAGLWYDAFGTISKLLENNPAQLDYKYQRAALLDQVGLKSAARFDRPMESN